MTRQEIRDARWTRHQSHIQKANAQLPNADKNWILVVPAQQDGAAHLFSLPMVVNDSLDESIVKWNESFEEELKTQTEENFSTNKLIAGMSAIVSNNISELPPKVQHEIIWYLVCHFSKHEDGKYFEKYDFERVIILDFKVVNTPESEKK